MLINEYLKMIYLKYIPKKSFKFIDNIVIYIENKQVYKVLLRCVVEIYRQITKSIKEAKDKQSIQIHPKPSRRNTNR